MQTLVQKEIGRVTRDENQLGRHGYTIAGPEVRMMVNGQNILVDLVGYNEETNNFLVIEVKTGQHAWLTANQRRSGVFSTRNSTISEKTTLMRGGQQIN